MNMLMSGISLLGLWLAWRFIWQPTLLDTTRDRLFDLRDQSRSWFLAHGYTLDNPTYRALRRLLNSHLLMTDSVTFSSFLIFLHFESSIKNIDDHLEMKIEQEFATADKEIEEYVQNIRNRALSVMLFQMVFRNVFLTLGFVFYAVYFTIRSFLGEIARHTVPQHLFKTCASAMMGALLAFLTLVVASPLSGIRIEKYSLSQPGYSREC